MARTDVAIINNFIGFGRGRKDHVGIGIALRVGSGFAISILCITTCGKYTIIGKCCLCSIL